MARSAGAQGSVWLSSGTGAVLSGQEPRIPAGDPGRVPPLRTAGIPPEGVWPEDEMGLLGPRPRLHVLVIRGRGVFLGGVGLQEEGVGDGVLHLEKAEGQWGCCPLRSHGGGGGGEGGQAWLEAHLRFGSRVSAGGVGCGREAQSAGPCCGGHCARCPGPKPPRAQAAPGPSRPPGRRAFVLRGKAGSCLGLRCWDKLQGKTSATLGR